MCEFEEEKSIQSGPDRDAGREHFHRIGHDRPIMLEPRDPVLYFVQRLRDEGAVAEALIVTAVGLVVAIAAT